MDDLISYAHVYFQRPLIAVSINIINLNCSVSSTYQTNSRSSVKNPNSVSLRQPDRNSSRQAFVPISALSSDKCEMSLSVAARNSLYFVGCRAALKLAWPGCRKCREQLIDPGFILADRCNFSYCGSEFYDLVRSALIKAFVLT